MTRGAAYYINDVTVERALLEADHGNARHAVALAREGLKGGANVRAEHALGWGLTRAGRPAEGCAGPWQAAKAGRALERLDA